MLQSSGVRSRFFTIHVLHREKPPSRIGLIASRQVGNAVTRNRAKRRLRELFRTTKYQLSPPVDLVIRARPAIAEATFPELKDAWCAALKDLNVLGRTG